MTVAMNSHEEPEVDERVHEPGGRVAQQRLHPHAGAEVAHAAVHVALGGAAVVGRAALVVAHPQAHQPRADEQHDRGGGVEGPVDGVGDVDERLARDRRVVVPLGDAGERCPRRACRARRARRRRGRAGAASAAATALHAARTLLRTRRAALRRFLQRPARGGGARGRRAASCDEAGDRRGGASNARWPSTTSSIGVSAITVALRGAWSSRARSPKKPPGPSVGHLLAVALDPGLARRGSRRTRRRRRPRSRRPCPASTCTCSADFATSWSSFLEQAEKSGHRSRGCRRRHRVRAMAGNATTRGSPRQGAGECTGAE